MRHFFAHVAGESFRNDDGSDRQAIIQRCQVGEPLTLEHEPDNPHDINAVRVLRRTGEQIGYLERDFAGQVVSGSAKGTDYLAFVAGVGRGGGGLYGVALLIVVNDDDVGDATVERYVRRMLAKDRPVEYRERAAKPRLTEGSGDRRVVIAVIVMLVLAVLVGVALRLLL